MHSRTLLVATTKWTEKASDNCIPTIAIVASLHLSSLLPTGANLTSALAAIEHFFTPNSNPTLDASAANTKPAENTFVTLLTDFLTSRTSLENTSILLALCTFLILAMSWASRFNNLGRFSPFTRSPPPGSTKVSDADFSYITADDLRRHGADGVAPHTESDLQSQSSRGQYTGPPRDTDALVMRNKRKDVTVHFPAYGIEKGDLTIGQVRDAAAKKMGTVDPRRVKLLYRGKNLKDDTRTAKSEGLRHESELLCTVAESMPSADASEDDEDDNEADGADGDEATADGEPRRRRNRGKKSKKRNKREQNQGSGTSTPTLQPPGVSAQHSRAPSPKPIPTTPIGKLAALRAKLMEFMPETTKFLQSPPADPAKREFDHKRLSETILAQVLLKLDAVETEGDPEARATRKELVRETQAVLTELDAAVKR